MAPHGCKKPKKPPLKKLPSKKPPTKKLTLKKKPSCKGPTPARAAKQTQRRLEESAKHSSDIARYCRRSQAPPCRQDEEDEVASPDGEMLPAAASQLSAVSDSLPGPTQTWAVETPAVSPTQPVTQPEPNAAASTLPVAKACSPTQPATPPVHQAPAAEALAAARCAATPSREASPPVLQQASASSPAPRSSVDIRHGMDDSEDDLPGPTQMWGAALEATPTPSPSPPRRCRRPAASREDHVRSCSPQRQSSPHVPVPISPTLTWHQSSRSPDPDSSASLDRQQ